MNEISYNNGLNSISLNNRPYGNLAFEQEIDQVFLWMENWNLNQINNGIVQFVKESSLPIKRVLCTILEPLLHRDFVYHNFETGPEVTFSPISTYITRELYDKLEKDVNRSLKRRQKGTYRLESAHLKTEVDVRNWSNESVVPNVKSNLYRQCATIEYYSRTNKKHLFNEKQVKNMPTDAYIDKNNTMEVIGKNNIDNEACIYNRGNVGDNNDCSSARSNLWPHHSVALNSQVPPPLTSKKLFSNKNLFQSPSRSTLLQRSKTQLTLPPIKPLALHKVTPRYTSDIFQKFPLSLKANRRHLQSDNRRKSEGNLRQNASDENDLRLSCSTPNVGTVGKASVVKLNYKIQISKACMWLSSWSKWQEEYFMRMFLKLLSSAQLYFMYALLMVQLYCDIVSLLPDELSLKIFSYLKPKNLISCAKASKRWSSLSLHDDLWKNICVRKKIACISPFFKSYSQYKKININWRDGKYAMSDFTKQDATVTSMDVHEDLLATGSSDKLIKIWKLSQGKCVQVLEGHQKCVWALQFVSSLLLISCSNDQTIKVWNLRTGYCSRTIIGHDGAVWCLQFRGEYFVSGSSDRSAKVWNLRSCSLVRSFNNHPGGVYAVAMSSDAKKVFTGTIDRTIRIWHILKTDYVASVQVGGPLTPLAPVSSLSYDKGYLWCACANEFQIWDIETLQIMSSYMDAHKKIECGQMTIWKDGRNAERNESDHSLKGRIITCGKDGKLKIWDLVSPKPLLTIFIPDETMPFVLFDDRKIVFSCTGSQEATVKIANFSWNV